MLGLFVVFILSWVMLRLFLKESILVLGIRPNSRRLKEFLIGFILMAILCVINTISQSYFKGIEYIQNPNYGFLESLDGIWWTIKAALLEELIFRGAILFILIKKIGSIKACIISSIAFGIYHWFSYNMLGGRIIPMIYVFLLTGAGGWMFALAFNKTKSIYASFGLHFGWIVMSIVVFSAGPLGNQFLIPKGDIVALNGWLTLVFFLFQTLLIPGIATWYFLKMYKVP